MTRAAILSVGNAVVDVLAPVPSLPPRGGDVLAQGGRSVPGGSGLTALLAAVAAGARGWFAGPIGSGPFGDLVRNALSSAGVVPMLPPVTDRDTGCSVVLAEPDGERTFVTVPGAEASVPDLSEIAPPRPGFVHATGYGLQTAERAAAVAGWLRRLPPDVVLLLDPGPLDVAPGALAAFLPRVDWWSGSSAEAFRATGAADVAAAAASLADRVRAGAIVRDGARGCVLAVRGTAPVEIPAFRVDVGTTNGAGDVHVGTFLAALGAGSAPAEAALRANEAAAGRIARTG
jgi:sugar/nucleoside kinase (ribokinase family)